MRYSRVRRKKKQRNYARLFLLLIIVFAAIYFGSATAIGKRLSSFIAPRLKLDNLFGDLKKEDEIEDEQKDDIKKPDVVEDRGSEGDIEKVTENIKVEPISIYAIQLGAFSTKENAQILSDDIKARGAAGYILEDKYFRVLAVGYVDELDAQKVEDQLKDQDIVSQMYKISVPGVNMKVTASKEKLEDIESAYANWGKCIEGIEAIIKDLDSKTISGESANKRLRDMQGDMDIILTKIGEYKKVEDSSSILIGLEDIYIKGIEILDGLIAKGYSDEVALSSSIKHASFEIINGYREYMNKIVGEL
ncbi:MAG: SPOR domain-containing protein [Clostridiales bacterium]|nr:SPOR domain-containing protein [Clostridiales bacterium]